MLTHYKINTYKYKITDLTDKRSEHVTSKHINEHTREKNHLFSDFQAAAFILMPHEHFWFSLDATTYRTVQFLVSLDTIDTILSVNS